MGHDLPLHWSTRWPMRLRTMRRALPWRHSRFSPPANGRGYFSTQRAIVARNALVSALRGAAQRAGSRGNQQAAACTGRAGEQRHILYQPSFRSAGGSSPRCRTSHAARRRPLLPSPGWRAFCKFARLFLIVFGVEIAFDNPSFAAAASASGRPPNWSTSPSCRAVPPAPDAPFGNFAHLFDRLFAAFGDQPVKQA